MQFNLTPLQNFLQSPKNKTLKYIDPEFLVWLIGFWEADGSIVRAGANSDNSPRVMEIKITQGSKDVQVLNHIQETLGFGKVSVQEWLDKEKTIPKTHKWHIGIGKYEHVAKIMLLLNGNLVTKSKCDDFRYLFHERSATNSDEARNLIKYLGNDFVLQDEKKPELMSFNNAWISGYLDGDGCWNISLSKHNPEWDFNKKKAPKKPQETMRMMAAAEQEHEWIGDVIRITGIGKYKIPPKDGKFILNQQWVVTKRTDLPILVEYIDNFPHKTKKKKAFKLFKILREKCLKSEHWTEEGFYRLQAESYLINPDEANRKRAKAGMKTKKKRGQLK